MTASAAERKTARGGGLDANVVALLSLKLLLLAFFILLTSLGRFEERRVERVVRSLQDSFAGRSLHDELAGPSGGVAVSPHSAPAIDRLRRLFHASLPIERLKVEENGRLLTVELASGQLFAGDGALSIGASLLFDRLAGALRDRDFAGEAEVALLLGSGGQRAIELSTPLLSQAAGLANAMVERGVASERVTAGLLPQMRDRLRIEIRLFVQEAPRFDRLPGAGR